MSPSQTGPVLHSNPGPGDICAIVLPHHPYPQPPGCVCCLWNTDQYLCFTEFPFSRFEHAHELIDKLVKDRTKKKKKWVCWCKLVLSWKSRQSNHTVLLVDSCISLNQLSSWVFYTSSLLWLWLGKAPANCFVSCYWWFWVCFILRYHTLFWADHIKWPPVEKDSSSMVPFS